MSARRTKAAKRLSVALGICAALVVILCVRGYLRLEEIRRAIGNVIAKELNQPHPFSGGRQITSFELRRDMFLKMADSEAMGSPYRVTDLRVRMPYLVPFWLEFEGTLTYVDGAPTGRRVHGTLSCLPRGWLKCEIERY